MPSKPYYTLFSSSILIIILLFVQTHAAPFDFIKLLEGSRKGDTLKGLNELKKYLQLFGYLRKVDNDDDFNQDLESAIKTYQQNFNLKVTGTLTPETATQMMMPRCGMPDIVDGETSMGSTKDHHDRKLLLAHMVSHYSLFPNKNKWPGSSPNLTYSFVNNGKLQVFTDVINRSFTRWRNATSRFNFTRIESVTTSNIKIGAFALFHGDGNPFDGPNGVLAHAFAPTDGRLHFDAQEQYSFGVTAGPNQIHLETVAVHEIGHILGLGHSSDEAAIMYPSISPGQVKDLNSDDLAGIQALYGT